LSFTGTGTAGDNQLSGGTAADSLIGGDGNDTLIGGGGVDTLIGGLGDDVFVFNNSGVTVSESASAGTDTISTTLTSLNLAAFTSIENLIHTGLTAFTGTGDAFNNVITGGDGNDTLDGGDGNDTLLGGAGNDALTGGLGNDRLKAGLGNDTLIGGAGNDSYDFTDIKVSSLANGVDMISGFDAALDKIDLDSTHLAALKSTKVITFAGASSTSTQTVKVGYIELYVYDTVNTADKLYQSIDAFKTITTNYPQDPIANGAALVNVYYGTMAGTYLFLNDGNKAVTTADTLINLGGASYDDLHTATYQLDTGIFV